MKRYVPIALMSAFITMAKLCCRPKSLTIVFSLCFLLAGAFQLMAEYPVPLINRVAQEGFEEHRDPVFNLGFCTPQEWEMAVLGDGFPIYTVEGDKLLKRGGDGTHSMRHLVTPTKEWYFMINADNRAVAMLFVGEINGEWQVTGIGHSGIANEMDEMLAIWNKEKGYAFRFVRIYEARSDFLEVYESESDLLNKADPTGYAPFLSARVALSLSDPKGKHSLLPEYLFIDALNERVEAFFASPFPFGDDESYKEK